MRFQLRTFVIPAAIAVVIGLLSGCAAGATGPNASSGDPAQSGTAAPADPAASGGTAQPGTRPGDTASPAAATRTAYPFTVDNCGTKVTITHAPQRVIAIKSTSIEMMFALGLADKLVGVAFPDGPYAAEWAPAVLPPVISDKVPGQEATLALNPDLIYAGWESNLTADGAGDRSELASLGIATLVSPSACQEAGYQPKPLTWADIWSEIELIGKVFDVQDRAEILVASLKKRLAAVQPDTRGLTALWYSSGTKAGIPYVGAGIGSPQLDMDAAGLTNVAAGIPMTWSSMSWESIIADDPDVIVVIDSSWGSAAMKTATFEADPAVASLTAVKNKRYLIVPFPAGEAGVRSVEAVETLSAELAKLDLP